MPDLVTHTAAAYFLSRHRCFQRYRVLFYLGTILPDILARPIHIIFPQLYFYSVAIHTPIFMAIFTLFFSEFFRKDRWAVVKFLGAGIVVHFALDLLQKHLAAGYYWFFPFSWKSFEIGLFWPEDFVSLIPLWCVLVLAAEILQRLKEHSSHRTA
ncbi:hypothetical protein JW998_03405 [candidate division KSB1 bacterium]|nr:hypothetical protein [candidate division KSB1 bacterium]